MKTIAIIFFGISAVFIIATIYYGKKHDIRKVWKEYNGIMDGAYDRTERQRKKDYNIYVNGVPLKKKRTVSEEEKAIFEKVERQKQIERKYAEAPAERQATESVKKNTPRMKSALSDTEVLSASRKKETEILKHKDSMQTDQTEILAIEEEDIPARPKSRGSTEILK